MGGRRLKPNFKLSDIDAGAIPSPKGGGASGAGLGMGRPSLASDPPKRPPAHGFASPFSNFDKIVCVVFSSYSRISLNTLPVTHQALSILAERLFYMPPVLIFPMAHRLQSIWTNSNLTKN